jgi:ADP-ribose pyrophosphatase
MTSPRRRKAIPPTQSSSAGRNKAKSTRTAVVLSSDVVYRGSVFSVTSDQVTEPGGVTSKREVVRHSGSVVVLAIGSGTNSKTGRAEPTVLIERQYRHAAGKFLLELPAGRIEPGERPLAAAKRELIEETGFRARRWSKLVRYYASPGFLAEHMHVFLAEDIRPGVAEPEDDEKIEIRHVPLSELVDQIQAGKIEDAKTILSVLLYAAQRPAVGRKAGAKTS